MSRRETRSPTHLAEWAALVGADLPDHVLDRESGHDPAER